MGKNKYSNLGDLTPLMKDIDKLFKKYTGERCAISLAFTKKSEDYMNVHWCSNVSRNDGIKLFRLTAQKMETQLN